MQLSLLQAIVINKYTKPRNLKMTFHKSAVIEAMRQLAELRRGSGQDDAYQFALAWMVGARIAQLRKLPEESSLLSLTSKNTWLEAQPEIGNICVEIIWGKELVASNLDREVSQAASIASDLLQRAPEFYLYVSDALWHLPSMRGGDLQVLAPEACDLIFSLLSAPHGAKIWIPFDPVGQFTSRAMRLGLDVELEGPHAWPTDFQRLCHAVLGKFAKDLHHATDVLKDANGKRKLEVDYLIAVPPMGARLQPGMAWRQWEGYDEQLSQNRMLVEKIGPINQLRLDRSDAWTPAALWPRVKRRAVFLSAQSLLFARGQEQRLREAWIRGAYPIDLILSLPGRMYSYASIAPALLVFDRQASGHSLRMGDLTKLTIRTSFNGRAAKTLDLEKSLEVLDLRDPFDQGRQVEDMHFSGLDRYTDNHYELIREVRFKRILEADCNLQPSRHLHPELILSGRRLLLRDLVEVIRAPVSTNDPYSVDAIEVGIPDLGSWKAVEPIEPEPNNQVRTVRIRERRREESALKKGDIVMSIKGTVGKTALIDEHLVRAKNASSSADAWNLVTSGNCVALRPRNPEITSEYLLMYFRSQEFEHQRDALQVGAVIPHVTPDVLCDSVQIPVPSSEELQQVHEKYRKLCELEAEAEVANRHIVSIIKELWKPQS